MKKTSFYKKIDRPSRKKIQAAFRARSHHNALLDRHGGRQEDIPQKDLDNMKHPELVDYFV